MNLSYNTHIMSVTTRGEFTFTLKSVIAQLLHEPEAGETILAGRRHTSKAHAALLLF